MTGAYRDGEPAARPGDGFVCARSFAPLTDEDHRVIADFKDFLRHRAAIQREYAEQLEAMSETDPGRGQLQGERDAKLRALSDEVDARCREPIRCRYQCPAHHGVTVHTPDCPVDDGRPVCDACSAELAPAVRDAPKAWAAGPAGGPAGAGGEVSA